MSEPYFVFQQNEKKPLPPYSMSVRQLSKEEGLAPRLCIIGGSNSDVQERQCQTATLHQSSGLFKLNSSLLPRRPR
ncbi:hypothetical protein QWZ16_07390 [Vibrio ostreicida]|uniref:Uncharacterized protein n=1 Tax=Vibrio ostreicida TaxID=526588 RepID=A0ABT8BRG2_9VIBR|nr:hypothetical protein [Vibrio ostreicida]MDN3609526.1 hypothetical protein [Vibrio ostreicida]